MMLVYYAVVNTYAVIELHLRFCDVPLMDTTTMRDYDPIDRKHDHEEKLVWFVNIIAGTFIARAYPS